MYVEKLPIPDSAPYVSTRNHICRPIYCRVLQRLREAGRSRPFIKRFPLLSSHAAFPQPFACIECAICSRNALYDRFIAALILFYLILSDLSISFPPACLKLPYAQCNARPRSEQQAFIPPETGFLPSFSHPPESQPHQSSHPAARTPPHSLRQEIGRAHV